MSNIEISVQQQEYLRSKEMPTLIMALSELVIPASVSSTSENLHSLYFPCNYAGVRHSMYVKSSDRVTG